jgi:GNAT superfamily N-acetyltransferase
VETIRRISVPEAPAVAALWNRMCVETPDGGPLTPTGVRNIELLLAASAWHHEAFCLVALEPDDTIVGFVCGRIDAGAGLLPSLAGEVEEFYVVPEARGRGISARLAEAAVAWLRDRDVWTVRTRVCAGNADARRFWERRGFEADMVTLSLYRAA